MSLLASVLIVSFNDEGLIADCLSSVLDQQLPRNAFEVIVVDNASQDRTVSVIREEFPSVKLVESDVNLGYPAGMNRALQEASAPRIVMLSSDTVVPREWLAALLAPMEADPSAKVTHGAMLIPGDPGFATGVASRQRPDWAYYHDLSRLGLVVPHRISTAAAPVPTLHVAGASAALDLSILPELGGYMLDGDFFLDCDEIDLGLRVNSLGYKVLAVPAAAYYHLHPFNTAASLSRRMAKRLLRLERNKALAFYKSMHSLELLACMPILLIGGALKPMVYADRFPRARMLLAILGLGVFVWLGFLQAALAYFPRYREKRQIALRNRRQPSFWLLKQLLRRPALSNAHG